MGRCVPRIEHLVLFNEEVFELTKSTATIDIFRVYLGPNRVGRYLTGENLKVAWAKFSTLRLAALPNSVKSTLAHEWKPLELKTQTSISPVSSSFAMARCLLHSFQIREITEIYD